MHVDFVGSAGLNVVEFSGSSNSAAHGLVHSIASNGILKRIKHSKIGEKCDPVKKPSQKATSKVFQERYRRQELH